MLKNGSCLSKFRPRASSIIAFVGVAIVALVFIEAGFPVVHEYMQRISVEVLTIAVALVAISVQFVINARDRRHANAADLYKEFYEDHQFVENRLKLWKRHDQLKAQDPQPKFDYEAVGRDASVQPEATRGGNVELTESELATLNKVVSFFYRVRILLSSGEVSRTTVCHLLAPTYTVWDEYRVLWYADSNMGRWREVLEGIPELRSFADENKLDAYLPLIMHPECHQSAPVLRC